MRRLSALLLVLFLGASCASSLGPVLFSHRCAYFDDKWRCFDFDAVDPDARYPAPEDFVDGCWEDRPPPRDNNYNEEYAEFDWTDVVAYAANSERQCKVDGDTRLHCASREWLDPVTDFFPDATDGFVSLSMTNTHGFYPPFFHDGSPVIAAIKTDGSLEITLADQGLEGGPEFWMTHPGEYESAKVGVDFILTLDAHGDLERRDRTSDPIHLASDVDHYATAELVALNTCWTLPESCDGDCVETHAMSLDNEGELTIHEPIGYCVAGLSDRWINYAEELRVFTEEVPTGGGFTAVFGGVGGACVLDEGDHATCWGLWPADTVNMDVSSDHYYTSPPASSRWKYINPAGFGITRGGRAAVWTSDSVRNLPRCE